MMVLVGVAALVERQRSPGCEGCIVEIAALTELDLELGTEQRLCEHESGVAPCSTLNESSVRLVSDVDDDDLELRVTGHVVGERSTAILVNALRASKTTLASSTRWHHGSRSNGGIVELALAGQELVLSIKVSISACGSRPGSTCASRRIPRYSARPTSQHAYPSRAPAVGMPRFRWRWCPSRQRCSHCSNGSAS
jgi:hypothetical protein